MSWLQRENCNALNCELLRSPGINRTPSVYKNNEFRVMEKSGGGTDVGYGGACKIVVR